MTAIRTHAIESPAMKAKRPKVPYLAASVVKGSNHAPGASLATMTPTPAEINPIYVLVFIERTINVQQRTNAKST